MKTLLQINCTANWGSHGKIAEQIGLLAQAHGWISYIAYARHKNPSGNQLIKVGNMFDVYAHYAINRLFDREGQGSKLATRRLIRKMEAIKPDIVHLHIIHDHYLNFPMLFEYLKTANVPVIWTHHDLWPISGHCYYFAKGCEKWMDGCFNCTEIPPCCYDGSKRNYRLKKSTFTSLKRMTIVPVSEWLGCKIRQSFLKSYPVNVIKNGVDLDVFKPIASNHSVKYGVKGKYVLMGVAVGFGERKGFNDYIRLSHLLPPEYVILMVGVTKNEKKMLPDNIIGLERTQSQNELAQLYSMADILLSLSTGETFGMTMAEAFACGTPCIVYDNTAQPEIVSPETGRVVKTGDINALADTIKEMIADNFKHKHSSDCRKRAEEFFDKNKCFEKYVELYERLIKAKNINSQICN